MKRISLEEAKNLIPKDEDYTNKPASFFTLTSLDDGWEQVDYYVNRNKNLNINLDINKQYIYVLSNPSYPGQIKIGSTTKNNVNERAKQLSRATGVPLPFEIEWIYSCYNSLNLEKEIHQYFDQFRVNDKREFFYLSVDEAKNVIKKLGKKYN